MEKLFNNEFAEAPVGFVATLNGVVLLPLDLRSKFRIFPEDNELREEFESTKGFAKLDCWPSGMELVATGPEENQLRWP